VADPEVVATLTLALVPGIGSQRLRILLGAFGSADAVLQAPHARLVALHGISRAAATAIRAASPAAGERVLAQLEQMGLAPCSPPIPTTRRSSSTFTTRPGAVRLGDVSLLARPAVAIVGSRNHTAYGAEAVRLLAGAVSRRAVVVSGMARGIDALAHSAALDVAAPVWASSATASRHLSRGERRAVCADGQARVPRDRASAGRAAARPDRSPAATG